MPTWTMCNMSRWTLPQVLHPHQKAREIKIKKSQTEISTSIQYGGGNCLIFCVSPHRPSVFSSRLFHDYCCEQKKIQLEKETTKRYNT